MQSRVSVIICCHNSAQRLPPTLAHLAAQQVKENVPWEVIVVDNASTDGTSQVALSAWPESISVPLKVVSEPRVGLSHARHRGIAEANYEIISFIDDDNWVCPEWVQVASEVMTEHPEIGACGGLNEAVCETNPPDWFKRYQDSYAVGPQGVEAGDITDTRGFLWGAGLVIRKQAWEQLINNGFRSMLVGRQGTALTAGEDSELCFALRLAGWRLWYEPRLQLRHFLPARRLEWRYLRRLHRGFGGSTVGLDPYLFVLQPNYTISMVRLRQSWQWKAAAVLGKLLRRPGKLLLSLHYPLEGDPDVLWIESMIGRLAELLKRRKAYDLSIREVRKAIWRQIP